MSTPVAAGAIDLPDEAIRPGSRAIRDGLLAAGVDLVVHLPDSVLWQVPVLMAREGVTTVVCAREDEGVAIAAGAFLTGRLAAMVMEGSGVGLSGLILARIQLQRTPVLILASHSMVLGEPHDYHGATRLAGTGIFSGLGLPHMIVNDHRMLASATEQAAITARGQKSVVGLFFPDFVMDGEQA